MSYLADVENPQWDCEVKSPPDDAVTCLSFSPASITQANYLIAGSCNNTVNFWEVQSTGNSILMMQQSMTASVLDVTWSHVTCFSLQSLLYF